MVIDLGNVAAWPAPAVAHVDAWIQRIDGKGAMQASDDAENKLRVMFAGHWLRGYHCTRLLDHEIEAIKTDGMHPLTKERLDDRIVRACEAGAFTQAVRDQMLTSHAFAIGAADNRESRTCYFLPLAYLTSSRGMQGLPEYLAKWGGEVVYTSVKCDVRPILETIGRPSIVVCAFDVSARCDAHRLHSLLDVCMKIRKCKGDAAAELQAFVPVVPEAVWQPGDPEYDRLGALPRT